MKPVKIILTARFVSELMARRPRSSCRRSPNFSHDPWYCFRLPRSRHDSPQLNLMRVAFLTHEPFYPPSGGGSAEAVYLVEEFVRRGYPVHVFCPKIKNANQIKHKFSIQLHEFTAWRMGRYTAWRNLKYLLYPFFLQRLVEREARSVKFDLVFSQHSISAVAAGRLKRALRLPVVMNFLDYLTAFLETWPAYLAPRRFIRALERFELSLPRRYQADGILTVSDTLADLFAGTGYPPDRIRPFYFGYDSALFRPPPAEAPAPVDRPPVVVMHGSLDHHHLGPIALGALARVARERPETQFKFVGQHTAALVKFIGQAKQRSPEARIECTGFVPYAEVARHLSSAAVGMVPYEESTGVHCAFVAKIVEYLAVGLPTASTPLKGIQRYFHDEPLLRFAAFDGSSLGEAILHWLNEPEERRRALGMRSSQRVKDELDWRVLCKKAVDWVESVCAGMGASSLKSNT
ncbi:MAG: glycosyltransferase family 4 protein [Candidatus Omnitrophica bacterium]|nr:glycosyltransferase family 4 protein [Candidatus Omnitrophota bacterium]